MTKKCSVCGISLSAQENWYEYYRKIGRCVCKACEIKRVAKWRKNNPEKVKTFRREWRYKNTHTKPMHVNKECSAFLGVHIAERVLRNVFSDVKQMSNNNIGFDFICNNNKKIDVKSSVLHYRGENASAYWKFNIKKNTIADYFLCLAFDNRNNLVPMYMWMIPGKIINDRRLVSISISRVHRWNKYEHDINEVVACCDAIRSNDAIIS